MTTVRTLRSLHEATIRTTRGAEDAFASAALGARMSPGKKASVYVAPDGSYSYGIASRSTGGKTTPLDSKLVGEITPGTSGPQIRRAPRRGVMKQQLARIARSSRLSDDERAHYEAAAKKKAGRAALPAGADTAMRRASYGVDSKRKLAKPTPAKTLRTPGAVERAIGAAREVAGTASNLPNRKPRKRKSS